VREVSSVVGRAFAGTAKADPERAMHWVLGPQLPLCDPRRVEFLAMFLTVPVLQHGHPRRGLVLATRDAQLKVDAVVVVRRFDSAPGADVWASSTAIVTMLAGAMLPCYDGALPTVYADSKMRAQMGAAINKRAFNGLLPKTEEMHKEWADMPHWYVALMAVDPSAQGKGRCGTLMRAVSRMADAEGVPCYLECSGARNRDIYAHLGYEQKRQYTVRVEDDEAGSVPFEEFFAMVRPAATHAVAVQK
jgi:GNAT superfamily N-acetyltransferase